MGALLAGASSVAVASSCVSLPSGAVGWWPGDGHFFDIANTNSPIPTGVTFVEGKVGQAFHFAEGLASNLQLPNSPGFQPTNNQLTIEAWVKPDFTVTGNRLDTILRKRDGSSMTIPYSFSIYKGMGGYLGNLGFACLPLTSSAGITSTEAVPNDGQFHHVAVTFNGNRASSNCVFYIDGCVAGGGDGAGTIPSASSAPAIGRHVDDQDYHSNMDLDELGFYSRELSAVEIQAIFNAGSSGKCKVARFLVQPKDATSYVGVSNAPMTALGVGPTGPVTYQWQRNGATVPGQTGTALVLSNPQASDAGSYSMVITDGTGASLTSSPPATLSVKVCEPPPSDLAAWYPADGHGFDIVGSRHATTGPGVGYVPGKSGQAFNFVNTSDGYVQLPNDPVFQPTNNQLTIMAWVKPDFSAGNAIDTVLTKRDGCGSPYSYGFMIIKALSGYTPHTFGLGMQPQIDFISSTAPIPDDGQFHHIAATYDGNKPNANVVLYLDGAVVGVGDGPGTIPVTSDRPIAGVCAGCGYTSAMALDELGFFDRELSPAEVAAIAAAGNVGICKTLQCLTDVLPAGQTRAVGGQAAFQLTASGTLPLSFEWRHDGVPKYTNDSGVLLLTNLVLSDAGSYDVVVRDATSLSVTSLTSVLSMINRAPRYDCLAAWWPAEGNANDAYGSAEGSLQGSAGFTNGIAGQAFFPGTGYVDLGLLTPLTSFTISTWVRVDPTLNVGEQRVVSHDNYLLGGSRNGFLLKSSSPAHSSAQGHPWFEVGGVTTWQGLAAPAALSAGWHHLVGVRDIPGLKLRLYVDGALANEAPLLEANPIDSAVNTVLGGISAAVRDELFTGAIDETALFSCAFSAEQVAALYNTRPAFINPTAPITLSELTSLTVTNSATDYGVSFNTLNYSLLSAPGNAVLNPLTGVLTWTPTEVQGPGSNWCSVRVTDNGSPALSATNSFAVLVNEVNLAPILPVLIATQTVVEGVLLTLNDQATDADVPANPLTYTLISPPAGAAVSGNGTFTWTPSPGQGPGSYTIKVKVTDTNGAAVNARQLSATNSFVVQVLPTNHPPVLSTITNRTVDELTILAFAVSATDPDAGDTLTFQLNAGAPAGATIDAGSGVFRWTPTEAQGPGTNTITVVVTDNGASRGCSNLSATNSFTVAVREVNSAPVLAAIPDCVITAGETVRFRATATDSDRPTNTLTFTMETFSLMPPDPTNATLNATTGDFTWPTSTQDGGSIVWFAVKVADNGLPPLTSTRVFEVGVVNVPQLTVTSVGGQPHLSWNSIAGRQYQVQYASLGASLIWTNLDPAVIATGSQTTLGDTLQSGMTSRFYRVKLLP